MLNSISTFKIRLCQIVIFGFVFIGCSSTSELFRESTIADPPDKDYSIIYYIHADSDYLYHDSDGNQVNGNSQVLHSAHKVGEGAKTGEVFIFYQRPFKKFLGLFPRNSSQMYHYVNGELTNVVIYRHSDRDEEFLTTEAELHRHYRTPGQNSDQKVHFLYYGHEIPIEGGQKYHRTLPEVEVTIETFSKGIEKFLISDRQRFDLVVLSTCNNGSPAMAENLLPITDIVLASPQNLHLSHIDSESLRYLETAPELQSFQLARDMAEKTFNRLESEIMTAITITVYDFEAVREYRDELLTFKDAYDNLNYRSFYTDNMDCNEVEFFDTGRFSNGVKTWYKPARFGRRSLTEAHSGWGCRPLIQN